MNLHQSRRSARHRRRSLGLALLAAVAVVGLAGCSSEQVQNLAFVGLPDPASEQGEMIKSFWDGSWIAAWIVGFVTWGLMIWAWVAYRRRKSGGRPPVQTRYNIPIEALYTLAPLIMVFGIFAFALRDQADLLEVNDNFQNDVQVVGFRWSWTFNYLNDNAYEVGTPQEGPTLWLPVNETVRFQLNSPDVIHSFWVPAWLFKMDVIPGQTNQFMVTPNQTGEFAGKCAELCGTDHSRMLFTVKVVSRAEYEQHIRDLRANGQSGQLATPRVNSEGDIRRQS